MIEAAIAYWRGLAVRERRLVGVAAAVLVLAVIYLGLFEPAWQGRTKLQGELPGLRAQVAQVGALAGEAQRLGTMPTVAGSMQALRASLEQSVKGAGLSANLASLEVSDGLFELRFREVPHALWLDWLDTTVRETRLRVAAASLNREADPGVVSVRVVLEAPSRAGR